MRLTDEEIRDAVREADLDWHQGWTLDEDAPNRYVTFARAIEALVVERCAKVCEEAGASGWEDENGQWTACVSATAVDCAAAIRSGE